MNRTYYCFSYGPSLHRLFLDTLLPEALLILCLQVGIDLGSFGGFVAVHLSLRTVSLAPNLEDGDYHVLA